METKHTPGPWMISNNGNVVTVAETDNRLICKFSLPVRPEKVANRRLVAAAPELLEACVHIIEAWNSGYEPAMHAKEKIEAAIAKATGRAA